MIEIFPSIRQQTKHYEAVRVGNILINSTAMENILNCVNQRASICYAKMDELNDMEKLTLEILQDTEKRL